MLTWDWLRCVGRKLSFQKKTGHVVDYLWHARKPFQLPKTWLVSPRCVVTADVWVHVLGKLHIYFIAQMSVWEIRLTNQCALPWNMNSFAALSLNPVSNISSSTIAGVLSFPLTHWHERQQQLPLWRTWSKAAQVCFLQPRWFYWGWSQMASFVSGASKSYLNRVSDIAKVASSSMQTCKKCLQTATSFHLMFRKTSQYCWALRGSLWPKPP